MWNGDNIQHPHLQAVSYTHLTAISVYLPLFQGFFGTAPVLGKDLLIVFAAVLAGPVIMEMARRVRHLLRR